MRKPYVYEIPSNWWKKKSNYTRYIFRELTSIGTAILSLVMLISLIKFAQGEQAYNGWISFMQSFWIAIIMFIVLISSIFQTLTWFAIAPKAIRLISNNQVVSDKTITLSHYAMSVVASIIILLLVF